MHLRDEIADAIGVNLFNFTSKVEYKVLEITEEVDYTRQLIEYTSFGDKVRAFLLIPEKLNHNPAILINHQHNREHHLGKSEVCGLAGDPLQAFGLELVKRGFVVLAPDSICFEDRRRDPSVEGFDFWQHFNEMCYRILKGEYLMKKVLDEQIAFSCASGSACTYENRMRNNVGIEMASVIPNFHGKYDIYDLVSCIAPRKLLIVSGEDDKYSKDAPYIVEKASPAYEEYDALQNLEHQRYSGGHAITKERFDAVIEWVSMNG